MAQQFVPAVAASPSLTLPHFATLATANSTHQGTGLAISCWRRNKVRKPMCYAIYTT